MPSVRGLLDPRGPIIPAVAMAAKEYVDALKAAGRPYPGPQKLNALIDTGASCSVIDYEIVARLGLVYKDLRPIHTPSSGAEVENRPTYDVAIGIGVNTKRVKPMLRTVEVFGTDLRSGTDIDALIGWDILKYCTLVCNGPLKMFELTWKV